MPSRDNDIYEYLTAAGVACSRLTDSARVEAEANWRRTYGRAFCGRPRLKHGARAEHEYMRQPCDHYQIVPFSAKVDGLPVHVVGRAIDAYDCSGPLVPLQVFHNAEFFVCPSDLSWTMVHTHEDHALGGPYFLRAEWVRDG